MYTLLTPTGFAHKVEIGTRYWVVRLARPQHLGRVPDFMGKAGLRAGVPYPRCESGRLLAEEKERDVEGKTRAPFVDCLKVAMFN